jgi:hypothetical protein
MTSVARRSWAFMRVDDSACGGNLGCADRDGQWYAYDSDVPGNKLVKALAALGQVTPRLGGRRNRLAWPER